VPFEHGLTLAREIRDARFVALESKNHLLLSHEPAWARARVAGNPDVLLRVRSVYPRRTSATRRDRHGRAQEPSLTAPVTGS